MQNIFETIFDITYLTVIFTFGILLLKKSKKNKETFLFGLMAIILGAGDSFHLVPRIIGFWSAKGPNTTALGVGSMITSITMVIFYILLYFVWKIRYKIFNSIRLDFIMYLLATIKILLCLAPQNGWTKTDPSYMWNILRNIPFNIIGIIIIIIFFIKAKESKDIKFKYLWLAITLSFVFYLPVILFVHVLPILGMLMIPKTCMYIWIVYIGYSSSKAS